MREKKRRQRFFVAREIQATIAILVVIALLGGIVLQFVSISLNDFLELDTPYLSVFLMAGYIGIIVFCALFFTHRLVGPFKRLEYEMRWIADGELDRRLTVRVQDDWHVRNFVANVNSLINRFEEMSLDYNKLNSTLFQYIEEIIKKLDAEAPSGEIKASVENLRKHIHKIRETW